jgi:hypothetical protein
LENFPSSRLQKNLVLAECAKKITVAPKQKTWIGFASSSQEVDYPPESLCSTSSEGAEVESVVLYGMSAGRISNPSKKRNQSIVNAKVWKAIPESPAPLTAASELALEPCKNEEQGIVVDSEEPQRGV